MSDYNVTRDVAGRLTDRFSRMLRALRDGLEEEIVVATLMEYYELCSKPDKDEGGGVIDPDEDLLWAIDRVLQDFMTSTDYNSWVSTTKRPRR